MTVFAVISHNEIIRLFTEQSATEPYREAEGYTVVELTLPIRAGNPFDPAPVDLGF